MLTDLSVGFNAKRVIGTGASFPLWDGAIICWLAELAKDLLHHALIWTHHTQEYIQELNILQELLLISHRILRQHSSRMLIPQNLIIAARSRVVVNGIVVEWVNG